MDLLPDEFIAWYLFFMEDDGLTCPHCGEEISREELDECFDKEGLFIACSYCKAKIKEKDFE